MVTSMVRKFSPLPIRSLPEMTAMLLERTHAVLSALDSMNLTKALKAFKP